MSNQDPPAPPRAKRPSKPGAEGARTTQAGQPEPPGRTGPEPGREEPGEDPVPVTLPDVHDPTRRDRPGPAEPAERQRIEMPPSEVREIEPEVIPEIQDPTGDPGPEINDPQPDRS